MNYLFPHLSPAYVGISSTDVKCLNSSILLGVREACTDGSYNGFFPQRVPRLGFYAELEDSEVRGFSSQAVSFRAEIKSKILDAHHVKSPSLLPLLEFGLRIGLNDEILDLNTEFPTNQLKVQLAIIKDVAITRKEIAFNLNHDCSALIDLFPKIDTLESAAMIANRIIVKHYRYVKTALLESESTYVKVISQYLEDESVRPDRLLKKAFLARGVAMSRLIEKGRPLELVRQSLKWIDQFEPMSHIEKEIQDEIRYTTLLSLAKTQVAQKELGPACDTMASLTQLDALDSVGWSESALVFFKAQKFSEAERCFERAYALGPPARSLNAFYAGVCARELENHEDAFEFWRRSIAADSTALSPQLGVFYLRKKLGMLHEARDCAHQILGSPDLRDQLTRKEEECLLEI